MHNDLKILPDLVYPITQQQCNPLLESVVKLNLLDAGVTPIQQKGLALFFHIYDIFVKSSGKIDYRGKQGHARLVQDAMTFVGPGNPIGTRHGDLPAAHLALDFSDVQVRLRDAGMPLLPASVNDLLVMCADLCSYPQVTENRVGVLMDYIGKKPL
jgi:hypothetical protein